MFVRFNEISARWTRARALASRTSKSHHTGTTGLKWNSLLLLLLSYGLTTMKIRLFGDSRRSGIERRGIFCGEKAWERPLHDGGGGGRCLDGVTPVLGDTHRLTSHHAWSMIINCRLHKVIDHRSLPRVVRTGGDTLRPADESLTPRIMSLLPGVSFYCGMSVCVCVICAAESSAARWCM